MNMVGNLGGALAGLSTGWVLRTRSTPTPLIWAFPRLSSSARPEKAIGLANGYQVNFFIFASVYVLGVLCWLSIDATKPVVLQQDGATAVSV